MFNQNDRDCFRTMKIQTWKIRIVMGRTSCSRDVAISELVASEGDVDDAVICIRGTNASQTDNAVKFIAHGELYEVTRDAIHVRYINDGRFLLLADYDLNVQGAAFLALDKVDGFDTSI